MRGRVGHAATIELSPRQKLDVTNQIRALHGLHLLPWSNNYATTCLVDVSILLCNCFDNCVPRQQLRPFLSLLIKGAACKTVTPHKCTSLELAVFLLSCSPSPSFIARCTSDRRYNYPKYLQVMFITLQQCSRFSLLLLHSYTHPSHRYTGAVRSHLNYP